MLPPLAEIICYNVSLPNTPLQEVNIPAGEASSTNCNRGYAIAGDTLSVSCMSNGTLVLPTAQCERELWFFLLPVLFKSIQDNLSHIEMGIKVMPPQEERNQIRTCRRKIVLIRLNMNR